MTRAIFRGLLGRGGGAPPGGGAYPVPTTNLVLALALRRVVPAYAGPAIRVRRATDNVELDVGFDTNGDLELAALAGFLGAAEGRVPAWYDQSGLEAHAVEAAAAFQPIVSVTAVGGRPAVSFDAANTAFRGLLLPFRTELASVRSAVVTARLRTATIAATGAVSGFGLVSSNAGRYAYGDVATNKWHTDAPWDAQYIDGAAQADRLDVPANMGTPHIYAFTRATTYQFAQGRIGAYRGFSGGQWRGEIAEVLYYGSVLATADRQSIETNAMTFFGI